MLKGTTNEERIWNFLTGKGLSHAGAAGLMGNLYAESGLNPKNLQNTFERKLGFTDDSYTAAVDDDSYEDFVWDGAGYGLAQWTHWSRKEKLIIFAASRKCSVGDLGVQLDFLFKELSGSYKSVLETLKTAASVKAASDCVLLNFEKPADQSDAVKTRRAGYAQTYYDKYTKKGDGTMKLVESILTKNPCYTAGRKITVKGLLLHSVGCPQPSAQVFIHNWNSSSYDRACVHGFIDGNDGTVYQTLPWNHRGWHCGKGPKGSGNDTHIGVEMCEPSCIRYTSGSSFICSDKEVAKASVKRTYEAAVALFAMLCKQFGLNPLADGVIISHTEGYKRGIASNHDDPEHLWKNLGMGYTMDTFRSAVAAAMGNPAPAPAPAPAPKPSGGSVSYMVRITATDLNIRKGPGTNYGSVGHIAPGSYTIVRESAGKGATKWGELKSGKGWVSLDFCKKV